MGPPGEEWRGLAPPTPGLEKGEDSSCLTASQLQEKIKDK